jgi:hypothetical protein
MNAKVATASTTIIPANNKSIPYSRIKKTKELFSGVYPPQAGYFLLLSRKAACLAWAGFHGIYPLPIFPSMPLWFLLE